MGPSSFSLTSTDLVNELIPSRTVISYELVNPLHPDLSNRTRDNKIWTELSNAHLGFLLEKNGHYLVIANSGGNNSGVRYKITRDDGYECGGFCAPDANDYSNYFWLYGAADIFTSISCEREPHEIKPILYGPLDIFTFGGLITGADYLSESNELYLTINRVDRTQSRYESQPIIVVYTLKETKSNGDK